MKRVRVTAPGDFHVEEVTEPVPGPGQLLLRLVSAGICGGDIAMLYGRNAVARYPSGLGHECVAQVVVGTADGIAPGDHVVIYPTFGCGSCRACQEGRDNQCPTMRVMGISDPRGCFAELIAVGERQCVPISREVAETYGALVEPMAVAWHVTSRAGVAPEDIILVIGAGVIGLACSLVVRTRGVDRVLAADRFVTRGPVAEALGCDDFTTAHAEALVSWIGARVDGVDVVLDTVVTDETADVAARTLRPGGRYVTVASAKPDQPLTLRYADLFGKELALIACRNYTRDDFREAAALLAAGRVDPRPLVTASVTLDSFGEAVTALTEHPERHLKVLVRSSSSAGQVSGTWS